MVTTKLRMYKKRKKVTDIVQCKDILLLLKIGNKGFLDHSNRQNKMQLTKLNLAAKNNHPGVFIVGK